MDRLQRVGASGFEPPTSWSRTRRANRAALRPETLNGPTRRRLATRKLEADETEGKPRGTPPSCPRSANFRVMRSVVGVVGIALLAVVLWDAFETIILPRRVRDRKSTRLNSSHGYISYAVFCL